MIPDNIKLGQSYSNKTECLHRQGKEFVAFSLVPINRLYLYFYINSVQQIHMQRDLTYQSYLVG